MTITRRIQIIIGLLLSLGVGLAPLGAWGKRYGDGDFGLFDGEVLWWVAVIVILGYVAFVERKPFSTIGFRRPGVVDILLAIATGVLATAGIVAIYLLIFPLLHLKMNMGAINSLLHTPYWYRVLLVTRAAVCEEVLFRAYPIERIDELTGRRWLAAIVSFVAFTLAHLSGWGWAQLLIAG